MTMVIGLPFVEDAAGLNKFLKLKLTNRIFRILGLFPNKLAVI